MATADEVSKPRKLQDQGAWCFYANARNFIDIDITSKKLIESFWPRWLRIWTREYSQMNEWRSSSRISRKLRHFRRFPGSPNLFFLLSQKLAITKKLKNIFNIWFIITADGYSFEVSLSFFIFSILEVRSNGN